MSHVSTKINLAAAILVVNGVYDLACAVSILCYPETYGPVYTLSRLHLDMYLDTELQKVPAFRQLMAYWIFTYGCVRIACGVSDGYGIGALTYFLEASCLLYEHLVANSLKNNSAAFVCGSSVSLGWYIMIQIPLFTKKLLPFDS